MFPVLWLFSTRYHGLGEQILGDNSYTELVDNSTVYKVCTLLNNSIHCCTGHCKRNIKNDICELHCYPSCTAGLDVADP